MDENLIYVWAWLAIGLAWFWVAVWQWLVAKSSIDIIWKNPSLATFIAIVTILWIALVESAAIYWLVVAFSILWAEWLTWLKAIWAWLSIWLTWFSAWIWEWLVVSQVMESINRNPDKKNAILTYMILFVALIEVVAIYWLIIAFKILG